MKINIYSTPTQYFLTSSTRYSFYMHACSRCYRNIYIYAHAYLAHCMEKVMNVKLPTHSGWKFARYMEIVFYCNINCHQNHGNSLRSYYFQKYKNTKIQKSVKKCGNSMRILWRFLLLFAKVWKWYGNSTGKSAYSPSFPLLTRW